MLVLERKTGEGFQIGSFYLIVDRASNDTVDFHITGQGVSYKKDAQHQEDRFDLGEAKILVVEVHGNRVKVGIDAPKSVHIRRLELSELPAKVAPSSVSHTAAEHRPGP